MKDKLVIGLMSGTSLDGIDAALVRIKEEQKKGQGLEVNLEEFMTINFLKEEKEEILAACDPVKGTVDRICRINFSLAEKFSEAVLSLVKKSGRRLEEIDLIGSHGQTIYHDVQHSDFISTLQIGTAAVLAERTGITTVSNFRVRDVAAGGEGAPLVPYVDHLLYTSREFNRVLQNIGGIGNYTYLPAGAAIGDVKGTDTGPGNMLIDGVINILSGGRLDYDQDGQWAARGKVSPELLQQLINHPFIRKKAPKTTGREVFGRDYASSIVKMGRELELGNDDLVATVTAFTAFSIADSYARFIKGKIDQVIIAGGGSNNPVLVKMVEKYCSQLFSPGKPEILTQDQLGYSSDAKEAVAFAVLAYQTMKGRANNLPGVTGSRKQVVLGDITPGKDFFSFLQW